VSGCVYFCEQKDPQNIFLNHGYFEEDEDSQVVEEHKVVDSDCWD